MSEKTIALLGQPNSGKSSLFNGLTGSRQHVGNWPGKTVERKDGSFVHKDVAISGDAINSIWGIVGYTVLLCFSLFKTSSVTKSVLGAH